MDQVYGHLNRPVHLARRNAFLERAVELLFNPLDHLSAPAQIDVIDDIAGLLKGSKQHAFFATRSNQALPLEKDLIHFLDLMAESVDAAEAMLQHRQHLEQDEGFLCQFLHAAAEQAILPAVHYQRRAQDILHGLRHMLQLSQAAYHELRQKNMDTLDGTDRERYELAYSSAREEASTRFRSPALPPIPFETPITADYANAPGQTSDPTLGNS